ncbi:MAG TPA: response regulator [Nitrososphaeraceae archaeon]|nr:response regulator [Nitrososphaeraceae archaeon]
MKLVDDMYVTITTQNEKYYSYLFFDNHIYSCHLNGTNDNHYQHNHSESYSSLPARSHIQYKESNSTSVEQREQSSLSSSPKRILIVDDDPDINLAFKVGLEDYGSFDVYTHTDPLEALSNFKPHFYDLLLLDINMPKMNGFELCKRILEIDVNVRICFITAGDTNIDALRERYPTLSIGCFIKKPVTIENLAKRLLAELD